MLATALNDRAGCTSLTALRQVSRPALITYPAAGNGKLDESHAKPEPAEEAAGGADDGDNAGQHDVKAEHAPHEEPPAPDTLAQGAPHSLRACSTSLQRIDAQERHLITLQACHRCTSSQLLLSCCPGGQQLPAQQEEIRWHSGDGAPKAKQPTDDWQTVHAQQVQRL